MTTPAMGERPGFFVSMFDYALQRHPELFAGLKPEEVSVKFDQMFGRFARAGHLETILSRLRVNTAELDVVGRIDQLMRREMFGGAAAGERPDTLHGLIKLELSLTGKYQDKELESQTTTLMKRCSADRLIVPHVNRQRIRRGTGLCIVNYGPVEARVQELIGGAEVEYFNLRDVIREVLHVLKPGMEPGPLDYDALQRQRLYVRDALLRESVTAEGKATGRRYVVRDYFSAKERIEALLNGAELQLLPGKKKSAAKPEPVSYASILKPLVAEELKLEGSRLDARTNYLGRKFYADQTVRRNVRTTGTGRGKKVYSKDDDALRVRLNELLHGQSVIPFEEGDAPPDEDEEPAADKNPLDGAHYDPNNSETLYSVLAPIVAKHTGLTGDQLKSRTRGLIIRGIGEDGTVKKYRHVGGGAERTWIYVTTAEDLTQRLETLVSGTSAKAGDGDKKVVVDGLDPSKQDHAKTRYVEPPLTDPVPPPKEEVDTKAGFAPRYEKQYEVGQKSVTVSSNVGYPRKIVADILRGIHPGFFNDVVIEKIMEVYLEKGFFNGKLLIDLLDKVSGIQLPGRIKRTLAEALDTGTDRIEDLLRDEKCMPYLHRLEDIDPRLKGVGQDYFLTTEAGNLIDKARLVLEAQGGNKGGLRQHTVLGEYQARLQRELNVTEQIYAALEKANVLSTKSPDAIKRTHDDLIAKLGGKYDFSVDVEALREQRGIPVDQFEKRLAADLVKRGLVVDVVKITGADHSGMHVYAVAIGQAEAVYHAFHADAPGERKPTQSKKFKTMDKVFVEPRE